MMAMPQELIKDRVREYWDSEPCGTGGVRFEEGSLDYFEEIENHRYTVEPFVHSFAQFTRWQGKRVLEVGCGCGTDLLQFARAGAETYGIDLSPNSVELVKKRLNLYGQKAEVRQADAESLPFPDEQFDLVYSWGVIHHTPDTSQAVKEIYRVLKPGGTIKIMLYNRFSWVGLSIYLLHGLRRGKFFTPLSQLIADYQESPGTKAYTVKEAKKLFPMFPVLEVRPVLTYYDTANWRGISPPRWLVNLFSDRLGWFMLINGCKQ